MLTLVTSNQAKYAPFARQLERMRIHLEAPPGPVPELQSLSFAEALEEKARSAAARFGRPVLVDDAGLVLEAYQPFPGPLTSTVLRSLGVPGLRRLLEGTSNGASMECHIGCWSNGSLRCWTGSVRGQLDFARPVRDPRMMLSDLFVPIEPKGGESLLQHRAKALALLEADALDLHLSLLPARPPGGTRPTNRVPYECPFCAEFENDGLSIFASMASGRLASRVVYEDDHFIVMPPLGQFMEGGLLVLTREHMLSMAHLPPALFAHQERLLQAIQKAIQTRWGVSPLIFEHGPAPEWGKGVCCVDHAHLNVFPAKMVVHPHLAGRMHLPLRSLDELGRFQSAEFGYLMVQENDGSRRVYDGADVPTQLVRRIIARELGLAERWHWRDYPGLDELTATYHALKGQIRL